jgi:hypothetical protein
MIGWLNVLVSISAAPLSDAEKDQLADIQAYWKLLNVRQGRFFVDIIGPVARLQAIEDKLTQLGRDPIVVAVFTPTMVDGQMVLLLTRRNAAEYLKVAPDVNGQRPTQYVETHNWLGWPPKVMP